MRARRRPVVDDYAHADRTAVYTEGGMVLVLSEVASVTWEALAEGWTPADDVAAILVHTFGPPGAGVEAIEATEATLRALAEHDLVELTDDEAAVAG